MTQQAVLASVFDLYNTSSVHVNNLRHGTLDRCGSDSLPVCTLLTVLSSFDHNPTPSPTNRAAQQFCFHIRLTQFTERVSGNRAPIAYQFPSPLRSSFALRGLHFHRVSTFALHLVVIGRSPEAAESQSLPLQTPQGLHEARWQPRRLSSAAQTQRSRSISSC